MLGLISGFILGRMTSGGKSGFHTMSDDEYKLFKQKESAQKARKEKTYFWSKFKGKDHAMYGVFHKCNNEILACFNTVESANRFIADMKYTNAHGYNCDFESWIVKPVFVSSHSSSFYEMER